MTESSRTAPMSGRELARARRREMALRGAGAVKASRPVRGSNGRAVARSNGAAVAGTTGPLQHSSSSSEAPKDKKYIGADGKEYCCEECAKAQLPEPCTPCTISAQRSSGSSGDDAVVDGLCGLAETRPGVLGSAADSVRAYCRERRRNLARQGKKALPKGANGAPAARRRTKAPARTVVSAASTNGGGSPISFDSQQSDSIIESACSLVESNPSTLGSAASSVRAFCRERRQRLAQKGKLALTTSATQKTRPSRAHAGAAMSALSGRERAKMRRKELCRKGKGKASACRPTGRVRPQPGEAPAKVEVGTTLSGNPVTGTQVERTQKVTGGEAGVCRAVTGTEYLGVEQFSEFCGEAPRPGVSKVDVSETGHGQAVTGNPIATSPSVTGDESGSCKAITGTEYLGTEHFETFCGSRGITLSPPKVAEGQTRKQLRITGLDEVRNAAVTGTEYGAVRGVTGTEYPVPSSQPAKAPAKVRVDHTAMGMPVSGAMPAEVAITGDDRGTCNRVTGTEYLSTEQFRLACGTSPEARTPKVGVDVSRGGKTITGNLVDRSAKVTGNEPGSCQRVTGSQYGEPARHGLCDSGSEKVRETHTLRGRTVTGTEVSHSPKLTGDERGGCAGVTGTEYVSQESLSETCGAVPAAPGPEKVGVSQTWDGQMVSGTQVGRSEKVTGDEQGLCKPVTGTSYVGREQVSAFCGDEAVAAGERRMQRPAAVPAGMPMSGIQPGPDESVTGVTERGVCQPVSGTPYLGRDQYMATCRGASLQESSSSGYRGDFSVMPPAREAQRRGKLRISGSSYEFGGTITGSVNKADGLISGTPEFRHPHSYADAVPVAAAPASQEEAAPAQPRQRITGEGETGLQITGDDWSRSNVVTGTEGQFAAGRNLTRRGESASAVRTAGAHAFKNRERPEPPPSRITGSSGGSTNEGAVVTLSGGAIG